MRYFKFVLPVLIVAIIDVAFQLGVWDPLAAPQSHAGMSVEKKRGLNKPAFKRIDIVTLGSSRPVYGLDHETLTHAAAERGLVYANLSVPGSHWMTIGVMTRWLARHHPEIKSGIIALAVQDFLTPGNGTYELGIVYPFHTFSDIPHMRQHVPFNWHNPGTYGLYSGLFEYHEDVQDFLAHPQNRWKTLNWFRSLSGQRILQHNADETTNLCKAGIRRLADCKGIANRDPELAPRMLPQCRMLEQSVANRYDLKTALEKHEKLPAELVRARTLIRAELSAIRWPHPPIVILMPMHDAWLRDALPSGTHQWALSVLKPLADTDKIRVLDYTNLFNSTSGTDCSAFFDFYHNNVSGRARLMKAMWPRLEHDLFDSLTPITSTP